MEKRQIEYFFLFDEKDFLFDMGKVNELREEGECFAYLVILKSDMFM